MVRLDGKIALVTGASRGVGKGIAVGLGEAGAEVWVTARTGAAAAPGAPGSLEETVHDVEAAGGRGVAVPCDLTDDAQIDRLFARLGAERSPISPATATPTSRGAAVPRWSPPRSRVSTVSPMSTVDRRLL